MPAPVRILSMAGRPDLVPVVAGWHWEAWGHVDPSGSLESWTQGLARRCNQDRIPASYVAVVDDEPVGSVVLVEQDMPGLHAVAHLSPWLAGLYVVPARRGHGIGSALVRHAEAEAHRMGASELYLYTSAAAALYERLGWTRMLEADFEGERQSVYRTDLASPA